MYVGNGSSGFKTELCHLPFTSFKPLAGNVNLVLGNPDFETIEMHQLVRAAPAFSVTCLTLLP
jgi:hypothetical protein